MQRDSSTQTKLAQTGITELDKVVFFDGVCNLCNESVIWIIKHDKSQQIKFAALQDYEFLRSLGDSVIYVRKGQVLIKSTAALAIASDMKFPWMLLSFFKIIPIKIRDSIYDWVAKNRYKWFGKKPSCMIPTQEIKARFIP